MKILLLSLYKFLVLTSAAVISPLVFLNTSHNVANRPFIGVPDPRFKIEVSFDGPKLPLISCLMNTVKFLVVLGSQDFSGSMEQMVWKLDDYPEVGMVIWPRTEGGRIERRFVIWGLSQGAAHMIHLIRFQTVTFTLSCTYSLLFSPTQTYLEAAGHVWEAGTACRFLSGLSSCLLPIFVVQNCEH